MEIKLTFTPEEIASLFRNAGLTVGLREMEFFFPTHGSGEERVILDIWIVENPHTGKPEKLNEVFRRYIWQKKNELFLTAGKLEIFNLFNK